MAVIMLQLRVRWELEERMQVQEVQGVTAH
jgi:hypothetical protein